MKLQQTIKNLAVRLSGKPSGTSPAEVRAAFQTYKKIMAGNNRAMEIIADMGDKLGGGYLFDITYIKRSYEDLSAAVGQSVQEFQNFTGRSFPLDAAFNRIDGQIRASISGQPLAISEPLVFLEDITWEMARDVGGKNFHLSQLKKIPGVDIPEGFALTTVAYDQFLRHNGVDAAIESRHEKEFDAARFRDIQQAILNGEIPPELAQSVDKALEDLRGRCGTDCFLAVRSSSEEEDDVFSFAGQFESVLNVPASADMVLDAYRTVLGSLFSEGALAYQQNLGFVPGSLKMAVGVMAMVDATASGVTYTADPLGKEADALLVTANWGLGQTVVEGSADTDLFILEKQPPFAARESRLGQKKTMAVRLASGGIEERDTPPDLTGSFSLEAAAMAALGQAATAIERYFHQPQDIEWAIDPAGRLVILQARPLRVPARPTSAAKQRQAPETTRKVLLSGRGQVVQGGTVAGRVFIAASMSELDRFPRGAILVARNDSPQFVRIMTEAAAIITDTGSPASHMAAISREFRVPTVVGAGIAIKNLTPGQEITLSADEDRGVTVYEGVVREIIDDEYGNHRQLDELYEFRKRKYVMRFIANLNLVNPLTEEFRAEDCKTLHDILRFIHEKSMQQLIAASKSADGSASLKRLELSIPESISVIDIGHGLASGSGDTLSPDQVICEPLSAVLAGMTAPGVWNTEAAPVGVGDFLMGMMRAGDMLAEAPAGPQETNVAVISRQYLNLALRFGYHYNLIDCYCNEESANNHIYFRFVGGATDLTKRSRRIQLIDIVLSHLGFTSTTKGDLIIAMISHADREDILRILRSLGSLIAYTRQLDAYLNRGDLPQKYAERFLKGDYRLN